MKNKDFRKIIQMAVDNEIEALEFYLKAAHKAKYENLRSLFLELAEEEKGHKKILEAYLNDETLALDFRESHGDYGVSDTVSLPPLSSDMPFADAIALAMKKEEEAMRVYGKFAEAATDHLLKDTFLQLARMEQGHKVRLEEIYTNAAYTEVW